MAVELVGGALLSSFLQVAFDRLASREILDYFQKRKLNETLLKKLKITMLSINAVVDDAEGKQINNPNVKAWLTEVKDALYDAKDVLDGIDYELTKLKVEAEFQTTTASKGCMERNEGTSCNDIIENVIGNGRFEGDIL